MALARVVPHLTAEDCVAFTDWLVDTGEGPVPVADRPPWDYARELTLLSQVKFDREQALDACELGDDAQLAVATTAECLDTFWRTVDLVELHESASLELHVPSGVVAKKLALTRRVVVTDVGSAAGPLSPRRGNLLAGRDDRAIIPLEGTGGRFPTEAFSFRDSGRPDAPWQLNLTYEDPDDSFAGSVQLLLNTDHPRTRLLVDGSGSDEADELLRVLPWDLGRQLIQRAINDERLVEGRQWTEGSVGQSLEELCQHAGLGSVSEARRRWELDPDGFEAEVKAGFGVLQ